MFNRKTIFLFSSTSKWSHYLVIGMLLVFSGLAQAQQGQVVGDRLVLPVVVVGQTNYSVELMLLEGADPPELLLTVADEILNVDTTGASFYSDFVLTVPSADVGGILYWGQFALISEDPVIFRLNIADLDDLDDDNDGILDVDDASVYVANGGMDPLGLSGFWTFTFTIQNYPQSVAGTACSQDPRVETDTAEIIYDAATGFYNIFNVGGGDMRFDGRATVSGNSVRYTNIYLEEGGETNSVIELDVLSPTEMSGTEIWTWRAAGEITCQNITSSVSGIKTE